MSLLLFRSFESTATAARGLAVSSVLFTTVELGATVTYSWLTDVMETRNGLEFRMSNRDAPHETYAFPFTLDDADIALLQGQLVTAAALGKAFGVALTHESIPITAPSTGTLLTVSTTAYSDWCYAGQTVAVQALDGTLAGTGTIQAVSGTTITIDANIAALAGYLVMPTVPCYLNESQALSLYTVNAGTFQLKAKATYWGSASGQWSPTGATVTTYTDSLGVVYPVWDKGLDTNGTLPHAIQSGTSVTDFGGALLITAPLPSSKRARRIDYSFATDADRQYLKKFHGTVVGQQCCFLLPTWRPDFVPIGDASAGTLKIKSQTNGGTDYAGGWFKNDALKHLQILLADGTTHYRTVTDAVDNLDGTQTLQLDSVLAGTIDMVSVLEKVRLASDDIVVKYGAGRVGSVTMPCLTVRQ